MDLGNFFILRRMVLIEFILNCCLLIYFSYVLDVGGAVVLWLVFNFMESCTGLS